MCFLFCFLSSCQANAKLANRSQDPCATCQLQKCKCEIALSRCCEGLIFGQFLGKLTWLYQKKKTKKENLELHNDWLMRDQVRGIFQFNHTVIFPPLIYSFFMYEPGMWPRSRLTLWSGWFFLDAAAPQSCRRRRRESVISTLCPSR